MSKAQTSIILNRIIGHQRQIRMLRNALASQDRKVSRTLLFCGPSGVGKKLVAQGWAQALLCTEKNRPCGQCSSCHRVESFKHPDFLMISPVDSGTIKIEQVRDIQNFASLRA